MKEPSALPKRPGVSCACEMVRRLRTPWSCLSASRAGMRRPFTSSLPQGLDAQHCAGSSGTETRQPVLRPEGLWAAREEVGWGHRGLNQPEVRRRRRALAEEVGGDGKEVETLGRGDCCWKGPGRKPSVVSRWRSRQKVLEAEVKASLRRGGVKVLNSVSGNEQDAWGTVLPGPAQGARWGPTGRGAWVPEAQQRRCGRKAPSSAEVGHPPH